MSESSDPAGNRETNRRIGKAGIVGAGLIGRSWSIVFARAGIATTLYDPAPGSAETALRFIETSLQELARHGLVADPDAARARITVADSLAGAIRDADWVQECAPEELAGKKLLFAQMDEAARPEAILASSTSGFPASSFAEGLGHRERVLVAHPVNPPHLAPLVEIAPAPWTSPDVVLLARQFMQAVGQQPILVRKEIDGFVLNRLQGAVLDEAFRLVEEGYASPDDVDRAMVHGLAPRWFFMGPFETIDLNAPGGLIDYAGRYGGMYHRFAQQRSDGARPWSDATIRAVDAGRRRVLPAEALAERAAWRDRVLMRIAARRDEIVQDPRASGTGRVARPVAMVTGGSRGIGRETCLALARRGFDVFFTYHAHDEAAEQVAEEVRSLGVRCAFVRADAGDPESVANAFAEFDREFDRLDALVNNAGTTGPMSSFEDLKIADLQRVMQVNVAGSFVAAQQAARRMSRSKGGEGGAIVNVASRASKLGGAHEWLHYAASKGAIDTFTLGLARELAPEGIRVNAVSPGLIATEIHAASGGGDRLQKRLGEVPMGRVGEAREVAETIAWLVADAPHYVTAASIDISGGR